MKPYLLFIMWRQNIEETASVYSEVEISKNGSDNLKCWEPVSVSILDELPEPIRKIIENPVF